MGQILAAELHNDDLAEIQLCPAPKVEKLKSASLDFDADTNYLEIVGNFVRKNAMLAGLDEKNARSLELAVDEMVSNAILHGYEDNPKGKVTVGADCYQDGIIIILEERGKKFNPIESSDPDLDAPLPERKIGGLGIFIVRKIADELYYEELPDNLKRFTLIKKK